MLARVLGALIGARSLRRVQRNDTAWTLDVRLAAFHRDVRYDDGEVRQEGRTTELIFPVDVVVSYISQFATLLPGDVIYTGTPGTTKAMQPGDVVEIEVEGVGVLRNRVERATNATI